MTELIRSDDLPKAETMPQTIARLDAKQKALESELTSLRELFAEHLKRSSAAIDHTQESLAAITAGQSRLTERLDQTQKLALRLVSTANSA